MRTQHIKVEAGDERVQLVVDDYELFDFLDDFVSQNALDHEYTSVEERNGVMHFPRGTAIRRVSEVLARVPEDDVQRIWSMNNA